MNSKKSRPSRNGKCAGETTKSAILTGTLELSENGSSCASTVHKSEVKLGKIVGQHDIYSVAFLVDGKHFVSGGLEGKIRRWRAEDGKEVGTPMDTGSAVNNIAVSRDGRWIVNGTDSGKLAVWDAESQKPKVTGWKGHGEVVIAVDISPDGKRIATGSKDETACVWSLVNVPITVPGSRNQSLVWASDSRNLFALSHGKINYLDVSTGTTLSSATIPGASR